MFAANGKLRTTTKEAVMEDFKVSCSQVRSNRIQDSRFYSRKPKLGISVHGTHLEKARKSQFILSWDRYPIINEKKGGEEERKERM